ncbi:MAG: tetratricopeptide repeat protein [Planctomycetes bacterium]|nr:tetratricopeptide repeat protein [Planctomycetota bacterium]
MFQRERSPEALLSRPIPERYRLAGALVKRALALLDKPAGDNERAAALLSAIESNLDDPTDVETLDDAVERCVDALSADPQHVPALVAAGNALIQYGYVDDWTYHARPLRDARKLLERALEIAPRHPAAYSALVRCELLARRFEPAQDLLNDIKEDAALAYVHMLGRGYWFALHENWKLAEDWFSQAAKATENAEDRSWALVHLGDVLARQQNLQLADARMGEGVLTGAPHRLRLHLWSKLKYLRARYDEAWELNRRSLTFGRFEPGQLWRQELLVYFRRLSFVPGQRFSLPEEKAKEIDGPFRLVGGDYADTGDVDDRHDDEDEFVPTFRANLFLEGENLPVVSEIADPGASWEGRAKLSVRVLDPRTFEKLPLNPGERFKPGQYVMTDEKAGTVFHVLLMRRHNLHNPYLDLPDDARSVFDFDRTAMQKFENAPWDIRLMLADHGFDPLLGALATCKLCDAFIRFAGGIGVDLETGFAVQAGDWRNEGPQGMDIRKHVIVRATETGKGRYHLRTWGLCKFRRSELEVRELPFELVEGARSLLMEAAEEAAQGAIYHEGDLVGSPRQPMMLISARENPDEGAPRDVLELVDVNAGREPVQSGALRGIQALMHIRK